MAGAGGVVLRAAAMLFRPSRTWDVAAAEPADTRSILLAYVAPLAAVPAVCGAIGAQTLGFSIGDVGVRPSLMGSVMQALAGFTATVAAVWLLAAWLALIAPAFDARRDGGQALKLVAYSGTPAWLSGVFQLYPDLGFVLSIPAGIYSLYVLWLGLPRLLDTPEERRLTFFAAILISILIAGAGVGFLANWASEYGGPLGVSAPLARI